MRELKGKVSFIIAGVGYKVTNEIPLLGELAVRKSQPRHVIVFDDKHVRKMKKFCKAKQVAI